MFLLNTWLFIIFIDSPPSSVSHPGRVMQAKETFQVQYVTFEHLFLFGGCSGVHYFNYKNYLLDWTKLKAKLFYFRKLKYCCHSCAIDLLLIV